MIGNLYKITNTINNKSYIGKTYLPIEKRFETHINDSNKDSESHRPLYRALRKYGYTKFRIDILGQYEEGLLEEKEIEFIKKYDTYNNGYNATLGGDGSRIIEIPDEEIVKKYQELKYVNKVAQYFNISIDIVRRVLRSGNIEISKHFNGKFEKQTVLMLDTDGNTINSFETTIEAGEWLIKNNYTPSKNISCVRNGVSRVINGTRKTYLGYRWIKV